MNDPGARSGWNSTSRIHALFFHVIVIIRCIDLYYIYDTQSLISLKAITWLLDSLCSLQIWNISIDLLSCVVGYLSKCKMFVFDAINGISVHFSCI